MRLFFSEMLRFIELGLFMLGVPLLLWLALPPYAILPVVWGMALLCQRLSGQPWRGEAGDRLGIGRIKRRELRHVLYRFLLCAVLLTVLTYALQPALLFGFVRTMPLFWALVMLLYPLLSVVPQEIIFRRYLFARFAGVLSPSLVVLVSGLGFGFAHIVFNNWVAPLLCAIGGVMFARTYQRTRSLTLVSLEHALYGDFIFTLGLGRYFYHGAVGAMH